MSGAERSLGTSGVSVPALGVGTNRWTTGDPGQATLNETMAAAIEVGMGFFDTAEVYGFGKSELALGVAYRHSVEPVGMASKFAPRLTVAQVGSALDRTLERPGRESLEVWMEAMATAVEAGKIRAVGVSNCNAAQMRKAADALARHGIPLAANQVQYSLLHRAPETNGVLDACREMDVALVAYRPMAGGAVGAGSGTSKGAVALGAALREVAATRDATAVQVSLAWLLKRDDHVIAIPGATKPDHVRQNSQALTLELSDEEFASIDRASTPTPVK